MFNISRNRNTGFLWEKIEKYLILHSYLALIRMKVHTLHNPHIFCLFLVERLTSGKIILLLSLLASNRLFGTEIAYHTQVRLELYRKVKKIAYHTQVRLELNRKCKKIAYHTQVRLELYHKCKKNSLPHTSWVETIAYHTQVGLEL